MLGDHGAESASVAAAAGLKGLAMPFAEFFDPTGWRSLYMLCIGSKHAPKQGRHLVGSKNTAVTL